MARQRPDASASFLDSRSSPVSASARKPPTPAPSRRRLGDLRDWLIVAWVLWWSWGYIQDALAQRFPALAGLDAGAVVIVSPPWGDEAEFNQPETVRARTGSAGNALSWVPMD